MRSLLGIMTIVIFGNLMCVYTSYGQKRETEITFCQFSVGENIKDGNASFSIRFTFEIGEDGKTTQITDLSKLPKSYVSKAQIEECISTWRFYDLNPGHKLVTFFRWEHGKGWTELSIIGKDFKQVIKLNGERCQYSKNVVKNQKKK